MITRAKTLTERELTALTRLGGQFYPQGRVTGRFDIGVFSAFWETVLASGTGALWDYSIDQDDSSPLGFLGALIHPCMFSGDIVAYEAFWFMDPLYRGGSGGVRLFDAFLDWAEELKVDRIMSSHIMNAHTESVERFYKRHAFSELERVFVRNL